MDAADVDPDEASGFLDDVDKEILTEAPPDSWRQPKDEDVVIMELPQPGAEAFEVMCWRMGAGAAMSVRGVNLERCLRTMRCGEEASFRAKGDAGEQPAGRVRLTGLYRSDDLLGDGRLIRTTTRDGRGWHVPREGSELRVRFSWRLAPPACRAPAAAPAEAPRATVVEARGSTEAFAELAGSRELADLLRFLLPGCRGGVVTVRRVGDEAPEQPALRALLDGAEFGAAAPGRAAAPALAEALQRAIESSGAGANRAASEVLMTLGEGGCTCSARDWLPGAAGRRVLSDMRAGQRCCVRVAPALAFGEEGLPDYGVPPDAELEYDVELLQILRIEDVSLDGSKSLMKKITREGDGHDLPEEGTEVTVRLEVRDDVSGAVLVEEREVVFPAASRRHCLALDEPVLLMKKGEACEVRCMDLALCRDDALGLHPKEGMIVVFSIELLDFVKLDIYGMEEPQRVAHWAARKEVGSACFQAGETRRALRRYQHVASAAAYLEDWKDAAARAEALALKRVCWLNAAACWLRLEDWRQVLTCAEMVLKEESSNAKALFRKAKALEGLKEFRAAERCLRKLLEHDKDNKEAARMLAKLKQLVKGEVEQQKEMFSRMARGLREGPAAEGSDSPAAAGRAAASATPGTKEEQATTAEGSVGGGGCRSLILAAGAAVTLSALVLLARRRW